MKKPNIVIIIIDALRTKNMGLFGCRENPDKNIQKIAKESVVFKNAISASNATMPSLTSLFTGKYPINNGIVHQWPYTSKKETDAFYSKRNFWLPSYLKNAGYSTIAIDWLRFWFTKGFDDYVEPKDKIKTTFQNRLIKQFFLKLPSGIYTIGKKLLKLQTSASSLFPSPEKTMDLAINKIKSSNKPFFLFLHFWDTHFPYNTVKTPKVKGRRKISDAIDQLDGASQRNFMKKKLRDVSLEYVEQVEAKYNLAIKEVDQQIGRFYDFLKSGDLLDSTLFIILADHGDCLGEHNVFFEHHSLYEETLHVPLIIRFPNSKGLLIQELVQNIDVAPTIIDFLGGKINVDGRSLLPILNGKPGRNVAFSFDAFSENRVSVKNNKHKIIIAPNVKQAKCFMCKVIHNNLKEAYNLELDPLEKKNSKKLFNELESKSKKLVEEVKNNG